MSVYREIDLSDINRNWDQEAFLHFSENGTRSLLVRNAFDAGRVSDELLANKAPIKYSTQSIDFKQGHHYQTTELLQYLSLIESVGDYYSSWGITSMNDQGQALESFRFGASRFVDRCLHEGWLEILTSNTGSGLFSPVGHFIAGNASQYHVKTGNHFVFTINHVFQLVGDKTWYICLPKDAMALAEFYQYNPMEYALHLTPEEYIKLPFVEELTVRAGDYIYNAPLTGHAVAIGPGKNVLLSLRHGMEGYMLPPELHPLLYRTVHVVGSIVSNDRKHLRHWRKVMHEYDAYFHGSGSTGAEGSVYRRSKRVLSKILRQLRRKLF